MSGKVDTGFPSDIASSKKAVLRDDAILIGDVGHLAGGVIGDRGDQVGDGEKLAGGVVGPGIERRAGARRIRPELPQHRSTGMIAGLLGLGAGEAGDRPTLLDEAAGGILVIGDES
jgi:hypothetical protein